MSPPVAGFLPLRSAFCLTLNFPNPLMRTSSPDSNLDLMISRRVSTVSDAFAFGNQLALAIASISWDFVRVIAGAPWVRVFRLYSLIVFTFVGCLCQEFKYVIDISRGNLM